MISRKKNKYEKYSKDQLVEELTKRDEQISQLQEASFHPRREPNQKLLRYKELDLNESPKVANLGHYSFDIVSGIMTNSEQLDLIFEKDENYRKDIVGWLELIHPDHLEIMQNHFMIDVIENKKPFNKEYQIITLKSKTVKWVHGIGNLKFNEKDEPVEMFGSIQDISARKKIEEAIIERESKLKESQKAANLGHYSFDISSGTWTNSDQLDVIFEIDEEFKRDVNGWLNIVHQDFVEIMQNHLMVDVIQNNEPFNKEYKIVTIKNKTVKWVHGNGELIFNKKCEPIEMFGTIQDITERKLIEQSLLERESKLKESQKAAKLGHYSFDILNGIWTNSEQLDEIFEIDKDFKRDVDGWLEIVHPDFLDTMQNHLLVDVLQNGKLFNKKYKIVTIKNKIEKWVQGHGELIFNEKGEPIEMFGIIQDIHEANLIEEALKESEVKLRKLFDKSNDAIFIVDLKTGKYVDANKSAEELTDYTQSELLKLKTLDISPNGSNNRIVKSLKFSKVVDHGEVEYIRKDGTKRTANLTTIPISKNYIYGIAHDLTTQKKNESEIWEARNKAMASDKMKSEFLAQMSHEIRSPINVVVNFLSLIKEEISDLDNEIVESSFISIESSTKRIIRTIDMILNMSDLQLGSYTLTVNKIEISELLSSLFKEYKRVADSKNIELRLDIDVRQNELEIDDYAFRQIVANLLDNATKYTKQGFIEISFNEAEDNYFLNVKDTGIGISEEYLPELFSAFSQETKGYTRRYEGTGLGLALVKKYCDIINAKIKVTSNKDIGTTFELQIPKHN